MAKKKKKKHQGHYCHACGQYKSNESFSGKGHAIHVCKACSRPSKEERKQLKRENEEYAYPRFEEYIAMSENMPIIDDDIDILPFSEPYYETLKYKKLNENAKADFRESVKYAIDEFWKAFRQIPDGGEVNEIMRAATEDIEQKWEVTVKNDKELRSIVQTMVISTINKILKRENQRQQEG